jgi:hypothetical protein
MPASAAWRFGNTPVSGGSVGVVDWRFVTGG